MASRRLSSVGAILGLQLALGIWGVSPCLAAVPMEPPTRIESEQFVVQYSPAVWAKDSVRISPDGKRFAVVLQADNKARASIDGRDGKAYAWVRDITFSADSRHVAYVATIEDQDLPVVDGSEGAFRGEIRRGTLRLSTDGARVAFIAQKGNAPVFGVVMNGAMEPANVEPADGAPLFSPDGKRLAYIAQEGPQRFVVLDGRAGPRYDTVYGGTLRFSPDGRRLAYLAGKAGRWMVVVDGIEGRPYTNVIVTTLRFSPDGTRLAYAAEIDQGKWAVVVNGESGTPYEYIGPFTGLNRSPDGRRLAYAGQLGTQWAMVLDGEEKMYDAMAGVVFSPDSRRAAYCAQLAGKWLAVVSDREAGTFQSVLRSDSVLNETLTFSPDGKHLVYGALTDGRPHMVVDGRAAQSFYEAIWNIRGGRVVFDAPTSFSYIAQRDGKIYLVREALVQTP